jgi:hypothetical protein
MTKKSARATSRRRPASRTAKRSSRSRAPAPESVRALQQAVESAATRLHRDRGLRPGAIVFRTAEGEAPLFTLRATETSFQLDTTAEAAPLLEVIGDPRRIRAIVRGEKDARLQFFAGGIRVRGDMNYLSELGMQLGFLKKPIV